MSDFYEIMYRSLKEVSKPSSQDVLQFRCGQNFFFHNSKELQSFAIMQGANWDFHPVESSKNELLLMTPYFALPYVESLRITELQTAYSLNNPDYNDPQTFFFVDVFTGHFTNTYTQKFTDFIYSLPNNLRKFIFGREYVLLDECIGFLRMHFYPFTYESNTYPAQCVQFMHALYTFLNKRTSHTSLSFLSFIQKNKKVYNYLPSYTF